MATYVPPKKNTAFIMYCGLPSAATATAFQANPTLAAGDAKVSIDGGALANLTTLPVVTPAAGKMVKVSLSAAEMNGDNITLVFSDQTVPAEWADVIVNIATAARQVDDLTFPVVSGRGIDVDATGGVEVGAIGASVITATSIATGAITAAKFAAGAIDNAAIAADAIGSSELAASAVTEIQTGLATAAALATAQTSIDDLPTNAELATALAAADDAVLAQVALVKAKTDNLPVDPADASVIAGRFDALDAGQITMLTNQATINNNVLDIPTNAEFAASIANLATQASLNGVIEQTDEVWRILGLDPAAPMTVTPTTMVATGIDIAISGDGVATSTLTRAP